MCSIMTQEIEIDAIGLLCPLPVLRAHNALAALPEGAVLRLLASDPAAIVDVPHFCMQSGHALLEMIENTDHTAYRIRRGAQV
jgi:tRNA 2-thiouridine synthesizing protein A